MFEIARSPANGPVLPASIDLHAIESVFVQQYCAADHWFGDLRSGLFRMGTTGARMHGLANQDCGLLTLLRTYQKDDRIHILQLLEKASTSPSKFCFCTHVVNDDGRFQPLICIGESADFSDVASGTLTGLFIFPRFKVQGSHY